MYVWYLVVSIHCKFMQPQIYKIKWYDTCIFDCGEKFNEVLHGVGEYFREKKGICTTEVINRENILCFKMSTWVCAWSWSNLSNAVASIRCSRFRSSFKQYLACTHFCFYINFISVNCCILLLYAHLQILLWYKFVDSEIENGTYPTYLILIFLAMKYARRRIN